MSLPAGARLGPYEILSAIGAGGMGEVYKCRDTRLDRVVAIKVLTDVLAGDPQFRDRFEREARTISQLTHPHICALYDVGDVPAEGAGAEPRPPTRFLVMEFLDGETVAGRLEGLRAKGKGLVLHDALTIAIQVAEGLAAAHAAGIVHRDLKPGNVMLTAAGAKLLDFGLAKGGGRMPGAAGGGSPAIHLAALSAPMTMTSPLTSQGAIVGTVQYMAPEQLEGKEADTRSDVFAFGAVVYEMLTGARVFQGKTLVSVMASILEHEPPPLSSANASVPASLTRVVQKCLAKDPNRRWQSAADLADELRWIADETRTGVVRPKPDTTDQKTAPSGRFSPWMIAAASLAAGVALAAATLWIVARLTPERGPEPVRFAIVPPATQPLAIDPTNRNIAISADATHIVYRAGTTGTNSLALRALGELDARILTGTTLARSPFFSPDGRWIAFFSGNELKKVSVTGGAPITLCQVQGAPRGGSWGDDGVIIFATAAVATGLFSVPVGGGEPKVLTKADMSHGETDHLFPSVLPGGKAVLFTINAAGGGAENAQIGVLDRQTGQTKTLIRGGSQAEYVEASASSAGSRQTGYVIYAIAGTLRAVRFDLGRLEVVGEAVPVVEQVMTATTGAVDFTISRDGTIVYVPGSGTLGGAARSLVWVNRQGGEEPIKAPLRSYAFLRLSPDGTRAALDVRDQERDIWVWDFARQGLTRLTFDSAADQYPVWTPDGRRIAFQSAREGTPNIFWQAADGTGTAERLTRGPNPQVPNAFSPDGTRLTLNETLPRTVIDLGMVTLNPNGSRTGVLPTEFLVQTTFSEGNSDLSPDGRWVAYQSNESGRLEVYVRPFPKTDTGRWQISTAGGGHPVWARSGRELFYLDGSDAMMAVAVRTTPTFSPGNPTKLFGARHFEQISGRVYDVSADGQRFLMIKDNATADQNTTAAAPSLVVVEHWSEELKARVPVK